MISKTLKRRNNNKQGRRPKNSPQLQLSKQLNLYTPSQGASVNIIQAVTIFANLTTGNYSLAIGSDVRFISFANVATANLFADFALVYNEYRIVSASIIATPIINAALVTHGMLYAGCDPEVVSAANPSNASILLASTAHLFAPLAIEPKSCNYTFPGVGIGTHIWANVSSTPTGAFYFGSNLNVNTFTNDVPLWDLSCSLRIDFRSMKSH
jgi:hypothetical protein